MVFVARTRRNINTEKSEGTRYYIHNTFGSISQYKVRRGDEISTEFGQHQQHAYDQRYNDNIPFVFQECKIWANLIISRLNTGKVIFYICHNLIFNYERTK
jgi:hypothetical protein